MCLVVEYKVDVAAQRTPFRAFLHIITVPVDLTPRL